MHSLGQACLGAGAKDGERNVVELTAENEEGEQVRHTLLSMRVGGTEQVSVTEGRRVLDLSMGVLGTEQASHFKCGPHFLAVLGSLPLASLLYQGLRASVLNILKLCLHY
jgi:hypothetical protein